MSNPSPKPNPQPFLLNDISPAELKRVFDQFDTNGDGKISADELHHVLSALSSSSSSTATSADDVRRAMEEVDTDKDGFIDLTEFSALCRASPSDESELRDAFNLYDRDGNGLISTKELHSVMNRLNMKCSVEDCERMIRSVDSDGDGFVNFNEFKKMMSCNANAAAAAAAAPIDK